MSRSSGAAFGPPPNRGLSAAFAASVPPDTNVTQAGAYPRQPRDFAPRVLDDAPRGPALGVDRRRIAGRLHRLERGLARFRAQRRCRVIVEIGSAQWARGGGDHDADSRVRTKTAADLRFFLAIADRLACYEAASEASPRRLTETDSRLNSRRKAWRSAVDAPTGDASWHCGVFMPEVFFTGPAGRLEGRFHPAKQRGAPIAVVLHSHPQFGGTMNNQIVYNTYYSFAERGFSVLRFNFRGVGRSQGAFDHGQGELSDAASALDWAQSISPEARACWIAGVSFGSWIGMQLLMRRPEIEGFISIAPPANRFDFSFLAPCPSSGLFVHGDKDRVAPLKEVHGADRETEDPEGHRSSSMPSSRRRTTSSRIAWTNCKPWSAPISTSVSACRVMRRLPCARTGQSQSRRPAKAE